MLESKQYSTASETEDKFFYPRLPPVAFFETDADGVEWLVVNVRCQSAFVEAIEDGIITKSHEEWKYIRFRYSLDSRVVDQELKHKQKAWLHAVPKGMMSKQGLESDVLFQFTREFEYRAWDLRGEIKPASTKKITGCSARDRKKVYSVKGKATAYFQFFWKELIRRTADKEVLKICYRYPISIRASIYRLACMHERFKQLCISFPVLAEIIANRSEFGTKQTDDILQMVLNGDSLKEICKHANVDYKLRKIKPQNTHLRALLSDIQFLDHSLIPSKTVYQRRMIRAWFAFDLPKIWDAEEKKYIEYPGSKEVCDWFARTVDLTIPWTKLSNQVTHLSDYIRNERSQTGRLPVMKCNWKNAVEKADAWTAELNKRIAQERALANEKRKAEFEAPFPDQWLPNSEINGYTIEYLKNEKALIDEGAEMHHCVASYTWWCRQQMSQIYSVKKNGERIGTLELKREIKVNFNSEIKDITTTYTIAQFRTKYNGDPNKEAWKAVREFIRPPEFIYGEFDKVAV